ncbi:MAG: hypothetical protein KA168_07680 [Chitinophagales bacterium]|jgi:peptide/nickel transport system substrate-binding protein|nr:hypothetical protein [Chitinophagales bacterium]
MKNYLLLILFVASTSSMFFQGCKSGCGDGTSKKAGDQTAVLHELADADKLNPLTSSSANSSYMQLNIFQGLLTTDFKTLQSVGLLAIDRPQIAELNDGMYKGGMSLTYEIRPEAVWDNGTPITAADVIFTVKAALNPSVQSQNIRSYYEFIDDIVADSGNPKKFTIYAKERYILAETMGLNVILPEYAYDPKGLLKNFTIAQIKDKANANNPTFKTFADDFNNKHDREKGTVIGSGAYSFENWTTGQSISLKRKANWWGDKVKDAPQLAANPTSITYKIVNDWTTAITAMKSEDLDVAYGISAPDFVELQKNDCFKQHYNLHSPISLQYDYLGLNMKNTKLTDKRVRRALAHLMDKREIVENLLYGLGQPIVGPIHPTKPYYNRSLPDVQYDPDMAKKLLKEAGWEDTDGDGVVDKEIDGQRVPLKLSFKYNSGNDRRKNYGLLLQESAKKVGIEIEVLSREWTVLLEESKRRDFDIVALGWVQSPTPDDLKQIWHTESDTPDGSNRVGFGNAETDRIIDQIKTTLDEEKRKELYMQIQQIIYDEQPYVFLVSPKERIAIHNRFGNAEPSINRPGFDEKAFTVKAADKP